MPACLNGHRTAIRVWIKKADGGQFKVVWDDIESTNLAPYNINEEAVIADATAVREKLDRLVDAIMADQAAPLGPLLKDVARAGRELYDDLFMDEGEAAVKAREWFEEQNQPIRLTFVVDTYVHVPWGLIFDGNPDDIPEGSTDMADYSDFWCIKYLVSCAYKNLDPTTVANIKRQREFRLLPIVHPDEFNASRLYVSAEEAEVVEKILTRFNAISDIRGLVRAWTDALGVNKILFFYCHGNGTRLAISSTESISSYELMKKLRFPSRQRVKCAALTFLNGCSTAVGEDKKGFIEAMTREGFCGFIGTEADIPNVYALRFGVAFLHCMLETGWSVLDVVDTMRRAHWPLSLLYQIYGSPSFRIHRETVAGTAPIQTFNFSRGPIGARPI